MEAMEDGELFSSSESEFEGNPLPPPPQKSTEIQFQDDILDDSSYVIVQRPKSSLPVAANSNSSMMSATTVTTLGSSNLQNNHQSEGQIAHQAQQNGNFFGSCSEGINSSDYYKQFGKKAYYNKAGVADLFESSDKDSSSTSDSDDDGINKRSRMTFPVGHQSQFQDFNTSAPTAFGGISDSMSCGEGEAMNDTLPQQTLHDFFTEAAKFQKQRKPNLVWSNVIQEEEISKGLGFQVRVGGGPTEVEVNRGPETYFFQKPDKRKPRCRRDTDSSEISSEGLSDNALHYLKDGNGCDEEETEESSEHSLPTSFTSSAITRKVNKRRRTSQKHKRKIVKKLKKMKALELSKYMAEKLKEEKVQLLVRAIETLGKDSCIHKFLKTLKIEKRGGIMIKSQERRRTPGGVFLYLIRGDRRVSKSHIDIIFRDDRAFSDKLRKKKIASKRKKVGLQTPV